MHVIKDDYCHSWADNCSTAINLAIEAILAKLIVYTNAASTDVNLNLYNEPEVSVSENLAMKP